MSALQRQADGDIIGGQRIFVIGRHRSGTTWVTNILAAHPKVFTPEHEAHKGQHESAFFSSLLPYCRMGKEYVDRCAISAIFERSDYWHLLFPDAAPEIFIEDHGASRYFARAMDEAAKARGCSHWVEKTPSHTLVLGKLLLEFPDARFISVHRAREDVVRSNVYKFGDPQHSSSWAKHAIWFEVYEKIQRYYQSKIYRISYESLLRNYEDEVGSLFKYIGLPSEDVKDSKWVADSSFDEQPPSVNLWYTLVVQVIALFFRIVPARLCNWAANLWLTKRGGILPNWFFRVYKGRR